jgi:hypothetical protein
VELLAFLDKSVPPETAPVLEICARVVLAGKAAYREPRWSILLAPDVREFRSSAMRRALAAERRASASSFCRRNVSNYREHDVTFDLFGQIARRDGTLSSWWTTGAGSGWSGGSPHVIAAWW